MATRKVDTDLDFGGVSKIVRALMNPVTSDPASPVMGEIWFNSTDQRLKLRLTSTTASIASMADVTGGAITGTLWDAQSVVTAVLDNTPVVQVLAASTVLGRRATGDIGAITYTNLKADLEALNLAASTLGGQTLAQVRDRSTHTGSQLASTISDFSTAADARITADTTRVTKAAYDAQSVLIAILNDTPVVQTFAASTVLGRRAAGDVTAITYANLKTDLEALNIAAATLGGQSLAQVLARSAHTGTQLSSTISDFNTAADARAQAIVDAVIAAAPAALNTLDELAAALGDDANFASTVNTALAARTKKFAGNYGNGALLSFTVNHALATTDVVVSVRVNATGATIDAEVNVVDANNVTVVVNTVYAANALRVVVIG